MQIIESKGLSFFSLVKVLLAGLFIPLVLLGTACGIAAFFGHDTVSINEEYVHGISGLIGGIVIGALVPVILSLILSILMLPGTWIWTRFCTIKLNIKD